MGMIRMQVASVCHSFGRKVFVERQRGGEGAAGCFRGGSRMLRAGLGRHLVCF